MKFPIRLARSAVRKRRFMRRNDNASPLAKLIQDFINSTIGPIPIASLVYLYVAIYLECVSERRTLPTPHLPSEVQPSG